MEIVLPYTPQPRQLIAHQATAGEILYGGAAGGGKSAAMRWDIIDFAINCPRFFGVLFRREYQQLYNNHIIRMQQELPGEIATWNESNGVFKFYNGSRIVCRHMEKEKDLEDIQGWEIHMAGVDEAGQFTPYMLAYIRGRLRLGDYKEFLLKEAEKNPRIKGYLDRLPRMFMTSNPGGEAHNYLKDNFVNAAPHEQMFEVEDEFTGIKSTRIFIPATMRDNRFLDQNYAAQFSEIPEWQRNQLVNGDWDTVAGAYFDCFDKKEHVVPQVTIPSHWTRFRAMDWGFRQPFAIYWFAVSDGKPVMGKDGDQYEFPEGALVIYREWYGVKQGKKIDWTQKGLKIEPEEVARGILDREAGEDIAYGVADPSAWRSDGGPSVIEKMANEGVYWGRASNERGAGSQALYQRLNTGKLYITESCEHLIRTLPIVEVDDKKPEEYVKCGFDHGIDAVRYGAFSRPVVNTGKTVKKGIELPTLNDLMKPVYRDTRTWI